MLISWDLVILLTKSILNIFNGFSTSNVDVLSLVNAMYDKRISKITFLIMLVTFLSISMNGIVGKSARAAEYTDCMSAEG